MKKIKYDYPVNLIHECFYKDEEMTQREIEAAKQYHIDDIFLDTQTRMALTQMEKDVLRGLFMEKKTMAIVGEEHRISKERVRQIKSKAFRKLRHPQNTRILENGLQWVLESSIAKENKACQDTFDLQKEKALNIPYDILRLEIGSKTIGFSDATLLALKRIGCRYVFDVVNRYLWERFTIHNGFTANRFKEIEAKLLQLSVKDTQAAVSSTDLRMCGLTAQTIQILLAQGYHTLESVDDDGEDAIAKIPGIGSKRLCEIYKELAKVNLGLNWTSISKEAAQSTLHYIGRCNYCKKYIYSNNTDYCEGKTLVNYQVEEKMFCCKEHKEASLRENMQKLRQLQEELKR